jgi:hypothetical protein
VAGRHQVDGYTTEAERYEALLQPAAANHLRDQARLLSAYLSYPPVRT